MLPMFFLGGGEGRGSGSSSINELCYDIITQITLVVIQTFIGREPPPQSLVISTILGTKAYREGIPYSGLYWRGFYIGEVFNLVIWRFLS
jgi:hypothetical protein